MCDCFDQACECCGTQIPIHIGGFSVSRNNLHVYCHKPKCRKAAMKKLVGGEFGGGEDGGKHIVIAEPWHEEKGRHHEKTPYRGAIWGRSVLFVIDLPDEIHMNW